MNNTRSMFNTSSLVAAALCFAAFSAQAGGTHADNHGHSESTIGKPGKMSQVTKTITVDMGDDMRFTPEKINVRKGDVVHFIVKNSGKVKHEMVLGTPEELAAHYKQMLKFPGMVHEDPQTASVAPGQSGDIVWAFTSSGIVDFACLQPGHFDAGMKGQFSVAK
jgi:uncharacterized cupredoxin-like copper-binding protein